MLKKFYTTLSILYFIPSITLAQNISREAANSSSFQLDATEGAETFFQSLNGFINTRIIPTIILLALAYVVYSGVSFIVSSTDSEGREDKKKHIFWGIVGLFVITSVWGLVAIVGRSFGLFAGGVLK